MEVNREEERDDSRKVPIVDEVEFRALHQESKYVVDTADGWSLVVTRFRPVRQRFPQVLFGEPLLLVHGFSQNRFAWTSGEFVKNLLFFGLDIHILELRGHGKSSIEFQREQCERRGRPLPVDLEWGWDIDSYFLYDLPAAVAGVRRITRRSKIFYCGHSMGGMLGYGYAGIHPDQLEGLITIGAPAEIGKGNFPLTMMAYLGPMLSAGIDVTLAGVNLERQLLHSLKRFVARLKKQEPGERDGPLRYRYVPIDAWLKFAAAALSATPRNRLVKLALSRGTWLSQLDRTSRENMEWLLREGGEKEPRKVIEQFMRWVRGQELVCYKTGYDFQQGFHKIRIPMAIIFGDLDPLASLQSTRSVYRAAQSQYLLWRPVKGNSHIELTMGHDIRQICYDMKNLIEYARTHRGRSPVLPRIHE